MSSVVRLKGDMNLPEKLDPMRKHLIEFTEFARPCVYFLLKGEEVVYVGQSLKLQSRIDAHRADKDFDRVLYLPCTEKEMDQIEGTFIRALRPKLNGRTGPSVFAPEFVLNDFNAMHLNYRKTPDAIKKYLARDGVSS